MLSENLGVGSTIGQCLDLKGVRKEKKAGGRGMITVGEGGLLKEAEENLYFNWKTFCSGAFCFNLKQEKHK